jgi:hypothetical protein
LQIYQVMMLSLGRLLAMVAVLVLVAGGLCLVHGDDAAGLHLCISLLAMTVALLTAVTLAPVGEVLPARAGTYRRVARDFPPPPPRA